MQQKQQQARERARQTANKIQFCFTGVTVTTDNNVTKIAAVSKSKGTLIINKNTWKGLQLEYKIFILCHEEAHYLYQDRDELNTDERAFKKYASLGYSLKDAVNSLATMLDEKNLIHKYRAYLQLQRALKYDNQVNNNSKAKRANYLSVTEAKKQLYIKLNSN